MRWPWRREARPIEPRQATDLKVIELQTAKEMLANVFHDFALFPNKRIAWLYRRQTNFYALKFTSSSACCFPHAS
ncbi:MAG: hypothetical protein EHM14_06990 [Methanothrix sp.]|nr:MAG: hypothetical protein EHM14_06990 [Methanothrix sp.]